MTRPSDFNNRDIYRRRVASELVQWRTAYKDTELFICAETPLETQAWDAVAAAAARIGRVYRAAAGVSDEPFPHRSAAGWAGNCRGHVCRAGKAAGVGPMAAVAGAFAAHVGQSLLQYSSRVIVENVRRHLDGNGRHEHRRGVRGQ